MWHGDMERATHGALSLHARALIPFTVGRGYKAGCQLNKCSALIKTLWP